MKWNYRVMAREYPSGLLSPKPKTEILLEVYSVYYDENGIPISYSMGPTNPYGESLKELKWTLNRFKESVKKPILWYGKQFPQEYIDNK